MLLSSLAGMILNWQTTTHPIQAILALIGIGLLACAGGAINQILDQHIDKKMTRTKNSPIPQGNISTKNAVVFIITIIVLGLVTLYRTTNMLTIYLTLFAMFGYSFIYTLGLKYITSQNIVIGGITGAMPPLLGWSAITGTISYEPVLLVLIIYTWTPPHFWALSIAKFNDYKKSPIPMLPVTHSIKFTKQCILLYMIITASLSLMPYALNMTSIIYLYLVIIPNIKYIYLGIKLYRDDKNTTAMQNFLFSIQYLIAIFLLIIADHLFL